NESDFHRASSWQMTIRSGFAVTRREPGKYFPAHASAFDYPALDLNYSNPGDCSKTALRTARLTGFDVVFEHQIAQVLALEDRRHRARQRDRQYLPRLVVDAGFILRTETERADRRVVVGIVSAPGPERDAERRLVDRDVESEIGCSPPDRAILAVGAAVLFYPASPNLALEHILGGVLDARLVGDIRQRRRAQTRLIGRAPDRLLQDRAERRAVQALRNVAGLIGDDSDSRIAIQRCAVAGRIAHVGRHQDQDGLSGITVLVSLDLVRVVLERLDRGRSGRGRTAADGRTSREDRGEGQDDRDEERDSDCEGRLAPHDQATPLIDSPPEPARGRETACHPPRADRRS